MATNQENHQRLESVILTITLNGVEFQMEKRYINDSQQHCCPIAVHHRACRWVYSTEEINSIMALTYCPCFGNGMVDFVPGSWFGKKRILSGQSWNLNTQG